MNLTQEKALFHLTGKLDLSQLKTASFQQMADEWPYFAPARFFLSAKSKETDPPVIWVSAAQKTNLYFTNPYWLQYQLDANPSTWVEPVMEEEAAPVTADQPEKPASLVIPTMEAVKEMMRKIEPEQDTTSIMEEEPVPDEYIEENDVTPDTSLAENKISGLLSSQLADFKKPVDADAVLDIDAEKKRLHTIDYFASQGIKIDLSAIPQDKLTMHLRKFTDWLKEVKHANTSPHDLGTNLEMEKAVAETAKNSNETREIVTETMADVLIKQGQADKAIQLYIKLSFLNPEKSSYFAAKIEQLKGI
jgi:hypothetical protein